MEPRSTFDKDKLPHEVRNTFEVVAAYFVSMYYNNLYNEAKKMYAKGRGSLTTHYFTTISIFNDGLKKPEVCKKILIDLQGYFVSSGMAFDFNMSLSRFVENIVRALIPQDCIGKVRQENQLSIIARVMRNTNKKFAKIIFDGAGAMIIDNHSDAYNVRVLQDEFIGLLMWERNEFYNLFAEEDSTARAPSDVRAAMQTKMLRDMHQEIQNLLAEKRGLRERIIELEKQVLKKNIALKAAISAGAPSAGIPFVDSTSMPATVPLTPIDTHQAGEIAGATLATPAADAALWEDSEPEDSATTAGWPDKDNFSFIDFGTPMQ